jgi:hypothetical protein
MTAPTAHGYPDWGRYAASSDKTYDTFSTINAVADVESAVYFVGDVPYISLFTFTTGNGAYCFVEWFEDEAITPPLWTDTIELSNEATCYINLPVRGPWLLIRWEPAATPFSVFGTVTSSRYPNAPVGNQGTRNVLLSRVNVAIGAGATVNSIAGTIIPGPAVWNIFATPATWTASVDALHPDLTAIRLDNIDNTRGKDSRFLFLPLAVARISVTNTSGAAGAFFVTLMAKPLYDGN